MRPQRSGSGAPGHLCQAGEFKALNARIPGERAAWLSLWEDWPNREVYAHPTYVDMFSGTAEPLAFVLNSERGRVLFPVVLRRIGDSSCHDLTTPYGYGGAFYWGGDREAIAEAFWPSFDRWARSHSVVSLFMREALFPGSVLIAPGQREVKQENVVVDLTASESERWMTFDHKVRKNVNKASRSGVTVELDKDPHRFEEFMRIYRSTMDRRGAGSGYYFDEAFFGALNEGLAGQYVYAFALHDGLIVSAEMALVSAHTIYSFLGGTDEASFGLRPNDALKVELMKWGAAHGKSSFVLGGGFEPGDGIFRYKRAFAPDGIVPFSVLKRVFDSDEYERLVIDHTGRPDISDVGDFFPAYRAPVGKVSAGQGGGN